MSFINFPCREISCKIVYYGPGLSGKTTNLEYIYAKTAPARKGQLISLKTESERTLFFDFLPIDLGEIAGFSARLQLYSVPGQMFYKASRRLILQGVDGLVFVADSQPARQDSNIELLEDMDENLADLGVRREALPYVMQYNKRDVPGALPVDELSSQLNPTGAPEVLASARDGHGVFETLKLVSKLVLVELRRRYETSLPGFAARRKAS